MNGTLGNSGLLDLKTPGELRSNPQGISNLSSITVNMLWSLNCWARCAMMVYCNLMVTTMIDSSKVFKIWDSGELGSANFYSPGF